MRANRTEVSGLKEEDIQGPEGSFSWDMEPEGGAEVGSGKAGGQHAFSVKGQVINILGAKGQMVLLPLHNSAMKQAPRVWTSSAVRPTKPYSPRQRAS